MLPKENRLILGKDFDLVYKNGCFFSFGNVSLKISKNNLKKTRIGFSIGVKFSPRAVDRNRAKRCLREIIRKSLIEMKTGFDVVIMLKKKKHFPIYENLEQDLKKALIKGNLIVK